MLLPLPRFSLATEEEWGLGNGGSEGNGGGEGEDNVTMGEGRGDAIGYGEGARTTPVVDDDLPLADDCDDDTAEVTGEMFIELPSSPTPPEPPWSCRNRCKKD